MINSASHQAQSPRPGNHPPSDEQVRRLAAVLRHRTVSGYPSPEDPRAFTGLLDFLESSFPNVFSKARIDREDPWRLVIEIDGSDASRAPLLLLGHFDVVPVDSLTADEWAHPPFAGNVDDGFIWGRGALDDKSSVMAILEATDSVLADDETPVRGLVIALGGDEELNGVRGASTTAQMFRNKGRQFHFILDEGSAIVRGLQSDLPMPIALVGLTEKGHANVRVSSRAPGGHAAMPPPRTAVGNVARAVSRIEEHPFPVRRMASIESFFRGISRIATGPARFVYRFPRLFWPLIRRVLASRPSTDSLIRTTQAVTMATGSPAANVLPQEASCTINVRILPGDTVGSVQDRYRKLLSGLPVSVEMLDADEAHDPLPETPDDHPGFAAVRDAVAAAAPDVRTVPFVVTSSTDSKHYVGLSDAILRFVPMRMSMDDLDRVHGTNERLALANYGEMIRFYTSLLRKVCWHE